MAKNKSSRFLKVIRTVANWHIYSLDFLGLLPPGPLTLRLRNGLRFRIRPATADRFTIDEVFVHGIYCRDEAAVGENDIVLDIGAHIGTFTALASKAAKNGRVYSFEPDEGNFSLLKENMQLNGIRNVHPINAAVSKKSGRLRFFLNTGANNCHSIYRPSQTAKEVVVDAISLGDFVKSRGIMRIDLLKMDCEGSEYEIMLNCPMEVLKMVRRIAMECHEVPGHSADEIRDLLEGSGFAVRTEDVPGHPGFCLLYAKRS
jgi:FkbM family methyltransferase